MQEVFEKIIDKLLGLNRLNNITNKLQPPKNAYDYQTGVIDSIDVVEYVAAEYNNGWIPCSERLPEVRRYDNGEPKCYLAMIKGAKVPTELYVDREGKWHDYCLVYYHHDYREFDVIAWQPLPQPYELKEGEA